MKKLTKLLCCGVLTCIMGISTMQTHIAANETHTGESATEKKPVSYTHLDVYKRQHQVYCVSMIVNRCAEL